MKVVLPFRKNHRLYTFAFQCLLALLLTACSSSSVPSFQITEVMPEAALQPNPGSHPPVILRVDQSEQVVNGSVIYYKGIFFTDADGDASAVTYAVTSSSLSYPLVLTDAAIEASADEQKRQALFTETTACWQKMELTYEVRIRDLSGNLSEPVRVDLYCTTPPVADTQALLVSGLGVLLVVGVLLLLVFIFLFRKHPEQRLPTLRSTVLLILLLMTVYFLQGVLHEGGHSLYLLARGIPGTLYVHTFFFSGFSRPLIPNADVSYDILGSAAALLVSALVTFPFWKRRSIALMPLVLLFPYSAMADGFNVMGFMGDFQNVVQKTGLPAVLFIIPGAVIFCIGVLSFFSLLPLVGLDPREKKALFVLPAAMWLISAISMLVAHLFVPGSPINLEYFAGREILLSVNNFIFLYLGIVLAVLYITLFRWLYPHLPAWLRTEVVQPARKDLFLPATLWAVCVTIGLIIVI